LVNTERGDRNKLSLVKKKQPCEEAEAMKIKKYENPAYCVKECCRLLTGSPPAKTKEKRKKTPSKRQKREPMTQLLCTGNYSCCLVFSNSTKWRKKEGMNGRVHEVKREEIINQEKELATTIAKNTPASTHQEGSHKREVSLP